MSTIPDVETPGVRGFIQAERLHVQRKDGEAVAVLEAALRSGAGGALAPYLQFFQGSLHRRLGDPESAIAIWAALVAILLLAIFSIVGSVLGAITKEGVVAASNMFNSLPMVCFWFLLVCLLAVGFFRFKRPLRSLWLLGAHLGSVLILLGSLLVASSCRVSVSGLSVL